MTAKYLLFLKYDCGVSVSNRQLGPEDEWIIYESKRVPKIGDSGFGISCYNYTSIQACEDVPCHPNGGRVASIEPYSDERAGQLRLDKNTIERSPSYGEGTIKMKCRLQLWAKAHSIF